MPPAVAAVAAVAAKIAISYAVKSLILKIILTIAVTAAINALAKKPKNSNRLNQGIELKMKVDGSMPRQVLAGRIATGGSVAWSYTRTDDYKKPNRYLYRVIVLSDQPCTGFVKCMHGKSEITFSGDITTGWRQCNQFKGKKGENRMWARMYLGSFTPTADATLVSESGGLWTSAHKGTGLCYVIVKMDYDPDAFTNGEPDLFWVMDGAKCYDDRLDSTVPGGSGTHRLNDYSTWEYTRNASVITVQYLRGFYSNGVLIVGVQAEARDLSEANVIAAANTCDQAVTLDAGGTEPRYRANIILSANEPAREHLLDLQAAMDGKIFDRGGAITILPGAVRSSVFTLTDEDVLWAEEKSWQPKASIEELLNHVTGNFVDEGSNFSEKSFPVLANPTWEAQDGGQRFSSFFSFKAITSWTQVQRVSKRIHEYSRYQGTAAFSGPIWLMELEQGDWFRLTSARWGFTAKWFEAVSVDISKDLTIAIVAREVHPDSDVWVPAADEKPRSDTTWNPPGYQLPDAVFALAAATLSDPAAGAQNFGFQITVTDIEEGSSVYEILTQYALSSDLTNIFEGPKLSPTNPAKARVGNLLAATNYSARLKITDINGVSTDWSDWQSVTTGTARSPARGNHDPDEEYWVGDIVTSGGSSYLARQYIAVDSNIAVTDTSYWQLLASAGAAAVGNIVARLTNENATVSTASDGTGGVYTTVGGQVQVYDEGVDVLADAGTTLAIVNYSGGLNSGNFTLVTSGGSKGQYTITGMSSDYGAVTISVTRDTYTLYLVYNLTKAKAGTAGASAKTLTLNVDRGVIHYDAAGNLAPSTQTTSFSVNKQNTTATVNWSATDLAGNAISPITNLLSGATGDTVTMSAANFNTYRGATLGVIVTATISDGGSITDRTTILRVQDGATGGAGVSVAELVIYRRSASAPSTPTGGSFNFGTQALTAPSLWSASIPAGTDPVYASKGIASVVGDSGTDSTITWGAPAKAFADGTTGADGQAVDIIFQRSATQPSTPAASAGTPVGWYSDVASVPAGTGVIWAAYGVRPDTSSNWTWDVPTKIEGTDGASGGSGANLYHTETAGIISNKSLSASPAFRVYFGNANGNVTTPSVDYTANIILADVGLVVGDKISASALLAYNAAGQTINLSVHFVSEAGTDISVHDASSVATPQSALYQSIENLTIPASTYAIRVSLEGSGGTGLAAIRNVMVTPSEVIVPYVVPTRGMVSANRNLVPISKVVTASGSTNPLQFFSTGGYPTIAEMGLGVGDVISASAYFASLTNPWRLELRTRDASNAVINDPTAAGGYSSSAGRRTVGPLVIPTNAVYLELLARRESGSGSVTVTKQMVNRGNFASLFAEPYAPGATVGAELGINLIDPYGRALSGAEVLNSAQRAAVQLWRFNGSPNGWSVIQQASLSYLPSSLGVAISGADPQLQSPAFYVQGAKARYVRVLVRTSDTLDANGRTWQVYYSTPGHGFSGSYYKEVVIPTPYATAPGVIEILLDMHNLTLGGTDWIDSVITGIRVDPGNQNGIDWEIDEIALVYEGSATEGAPAGTEIDNMPVEQFRLGTDTDIWETFANYKSIEDLRRVWTNFIGTGELSLVAAPDTGGQCLQVGNNSGNDMAWMGCKRSIPYSPEDLYEMTIDIECVVAGPGTIYAGVNGYAADGTTLINNAGTSGQYSGQHYIAASAQGMSNGQRKVFRGYFRGFGGISVAPTPTAPAAINAAVRRVAPMFIVSYNGAAGQYKIHGTRLRKVEDIAVVPKGTWSSGTVYRFGEGVIYLNRSFMSLQNDNVANEPPTTNTSNAFWSLVGGSGADGDPGYTLFTAGNMKKVSGTPGALDCAVSGAAWGHASANSAQVFVNGASLWFNTPNTHGTAENFMIGLNDNPTSATSYTDIDHALYFRYQGPGDYRVEVRENGTQRTLLTGGDYRAWSYLNKYGITYDGQFVKYWEVAGPTPTLLYQANIGPNRAFGLDVAAYNRCSLDNISFTPNGTSGLNIAQLNIYARGASAPAAPSVNASFNALTGVLSGLNNGWSPTVPTTNGFPLWTRQAIASGTDTTLTISPAAWSAATKAAQDGDTGPPGRDAVVFQQDTTPPSGSLVVGDTWVTLTPPRIWRRWNGSNWIQLLGNIAAYDQVSASQIAVSQLSAITATIGVLRTASFGARMEIRDNVIKVYDASGILRVQIGNLDL